MSVSSQYTLTKGAVEGVLTGDVKSHSHSAYAAKTHTHTEYAAVGHTHTEYAAVSHTHDNYALTGHKHTEYALATALSSYYTKKEVEDMVGNAGGGVDESWLQQHGYLKKSDMKETVVIKLVSDKGESDSGLIGATVTVRGKGIIYDEETWQGTPINVKVPCDKDVTIEAAAVKMYMKPKALVYVPSPLYNREVTFTYKALELGVFIIDTNDNFINKDSWSPTMQETTVGVALITEKVAIVISTGLHTGLRWSGRAELVEGVTTTTDSTVAATDYKGKANTEAIVKALGQSAEAAYYCSNYTFKNGKKGYLMAAGESHEIFVNIQKISELLNYINRDTTNLANGKKVWTSTQNDNSTAWYDDGIMLKKYSKMTNIYCAVVPIYSLYD